MGQTLYVGGFQTLAKEVDDFRKKVVMLAARENTDSAIVTMAIADILGLAIANLDRRDGRNTLDDRLHEFCGRVSQVYDRARHTLDKVVPSGGT